MMKLYGFLVLFVTFSVASGLRCYLYGTADSITCSGIQTCPAGYDRCASAKIEGVTFKECLKNTDCISPIKCCGTDLCNSAIPTGPGVTLLLLSSALMMLFI
ncbi:lymphocyte antigen 6C2-like isoform X2 [Poeciliopsis prolifica]|uniref:lymphocyte antigen 6C2-like isoform X2 n=1 Tax=Poeciliopsis prolifica TaxID=188132 RepID=UPI0024130F9E|nr:lymphocyte antigen 6C2-like isoform X2 [Poeciliopsis prolifica]